MNLSAAIMLVDKTVRAVRVEYDPETARNNNPNVLFKTIDADVKVDDLVVVETHTRHGLTVAKVKEVDFAVDFSSSQQWGWIAQRLDKDAFDRIKSVEGNVKDRVAKAEENKMRKELSEAMGLGTVDFTDLQAALKGEPVPLPAPEAPPPAPVADPTGTVPYVQPGT